MVSLSLLLLAELTWQSSDNVNASKLPIDIWWENNFWFPDLLQDGMLLDSGIKRIHVKSKSFTKPIPSFITPSSICALTHLSLNALSFRSLSSFKMILRYGRNLRFFHIKGKLDAMTHSQYF